MRPAGGVAPRAGQLAGRRARPRRRFQARDCQECLAANVATRDIHIANSVDGAAPFPCRDENRRRLVFHISANTMPRTGQRMKLGAAPRSKCFEGAMTLASCPPVPQPATPDAVPAIMPPTDLHRPAQTCTASTRTTQQDWHRMCGQRCGVVCPYLAPDAHHTSEEYQPDRRRTWVDLYTGPVAKTDDTVLW